MEENLKEILDRMQELVKHKYDKEIHTYNLFDDIQGLLDCITNLQEKYDIAQKDIETLTNNYNDLVKMSENKITNLKEEVEDLRRIFGVWNNRKLIKKFNKEYDKEDKTKNPNRDYVVIYPDAEEVYKRYYDLKEENKRLNNIINKLEKDIKDELKKYNRQKYLKNPAKSKIAEFKEEVFDYMLYKLKELKEGK